MSKNFYNKLITIILLVLAFILKSPIWVYIIILLVFLGVFNWGIFDIRLGYFVRTICSNNSLKTKYITLSF